MCVFMQATQRRGDERKLCVLQQRLTVLLDERQQLQEERRSSAAARSKLETLCRELQGHYDELRVCRGSRQLLTLCVKSLEILILEQ